MSHNNDDENSDRIIRQSQSGASIRAPPRLRELEHRNKRLQLAYQELQLQQPQYQQQYPKHINTIENASTLQDLAIPDIYMI